MRFLIIILLLCNVQTLSAQYNLKGWYDYYVPSLELDSPKASTVIDIPIQARMRFKHSGQVLYMLDSPEKSKKKGLWHLRKDSVVVQYGLPEEEGFVEEVYKIGKGGDNLYLRSSSVIYTRRRKK